MTGRGPRGPRGPHLVTLLLLAAVGPVGAQDTMTHAQLEAVRSRYPRAAQWEIRVRAGTRLDSLRRLYERRLHRIAAATDVEDQSPYPLWYRAYLRERFPTLPTSGRYQYPRVTAQMLTWMGSHQDLSVPPSRPPGGSGGPGPARVAMVAGNVDVSNLSERHSESSVAVDYHAPRYLIAASNNITGSGRLKVFFSSDGGGSWNSTELPLDEGAAFHSDPAVAWAPDGTAWAATLGIDIAGVVKVQMYRSTDRGATWSFVRTVSTGGANDKELMWIDTDDASLHKGNIYVAWDEVGSGMRFARSTDSGATWSPVATLSSDAAIGADLTTGPSGELYVAWPDVTAREIKVRKSTDGGATFGPVQRIAMTNDQYEVSIPAMCRRNVLIYVVIGVDRSSGPRRGSVYAAWDDRDGAGADPGCTGLTSASNANVYFSRSTDGGATWLATPVIIHSNPPETDQFNPWMDVDPDNGDIHVIYYDTRNDGSRKDVRLYYVRSSDGGVTWGDETEVATAPTDETDPAADQGNQYGDYNGLAVYRGVALPTWTDRRGGVPDGKEQIYTARISAGGSPPPPPPPAALTVQLLPNVALDPAQTATARATLTRGGAPVAGEEVLFATANPSIASVSPGSVPTNAAGVAEAMVTAQSRGNTTLTAASAGQIAVAAVRVPALSAVGAVGLVLAMALLALYRLRRQAHRS